MLFRSKANAIKIGRCSCFQPFTIPRRTRIVIRKKCVRKNLDIGACFCLKGWFSVREMYQKFHLVGVFGKRYLAFVFSLLQSFQTIFIKIWCCCRSAVKFWRQNWLLLQDWTRIKNIIAWLLHWTTFFSPPKTPSFFHFLFFQRLKQCVWHCFDIEHAVKTIVEELAAFFSGSFQGYSVHPPRRH